MSLYTSLMKKVVTSPLQMMAPLRRNFSKVGKQEMIGQNEEKVRFGTFGLCLLIIPSMYVGGMFSKMGASLLEDYDIFVPEDDDD